MAAKLLQQSLQCFIIYISLWLVSGITLSNLQPTTKKPRITKYSNSSSTGGPAASLLVRSTEAPPPPPAAPPSQPSSRPLYRVIGAGGATCILLRTDALIEISFTSNIGMEKGDAFVPGNAVIQGNCQNEDSEYLRIKWKGYRLEISFAKTPGGERWYVPEIKVTISSDLPQYHNLKKQVGDTFTLAHTTMLFPTPVGRSYSCGEATVPLVPLFSSGANNNVPPGLSGTLFLRDLQLQPFMYRGEQFEPPFECSSLPNYRDETAPIAVGSTLAIAVLGTITGYGIFRYFKIKKVQYNTME